MLENRSSAVVTAIASAEFESFVATTLHSQGWNIVNRSLDAESTIDFCRTNQQLIEILIISTDLTGLTVEKYSELQKLVKKVYLFNAAGVDGPLDGLTAPSTPLELIGLIRGNIRTPLLTKANNEHLRRKRARVIGVSSAGHATGCTTLAINLATELTLLDKKVLLIDAHLKWPAISSLLDERNINSSGDFKLTEKGFSAFEIARDHYADLHEILDRAIADFDLVILDLGSVHDLAQSLSGRRFESEILIWHSQNGDELIVTSTASKTGLRWLRKFCKELALNAIRPKIGFALSQRFNGKRGAIEQQDFLTAVTPSRPHRILTIPQDSRTMQAAEAAAATLYEINERSVARKAIAKYASELL